MLAYLATGLTSAQEVKIPPEQIPKAVMDALHSRFPKASITSSIRETEGGVVIYDIEFTENRRKGEADIDLAKHRNGETGYFKLTFQGQYTRFQNFAPDSFAEGVLR